MHESGFLAADESAGAETDKQVEVEAGLKDVLAQEAVVSGLLDGDVQTLDGDGVLSADIDVAFAGTDGIAGNGHGFDDGMGIAFEDGTVHESTRVAFVSIAGHILLVADRVVGELPLQAGGESAAAAAAQTGLEDFINDFLTGHGGQRLFQSTVAVHGQVFINVLRIDHAAVAQGNTVLMLVEVDVFQSLVGILLMSGMVGVHEMLNLAALEQVLADDLVHIFRLDAAVEGAVRVHDNHRAGFAQTEATGADDLDFMVQAVFRNLFIKPFDQGCRTGR